MNNVNSYLKKQGFEYTLFSNYEAGMVSIFERMGMYHIGNLDVDTKVGYVCLRMYATHYGQPNINDVFKFVLNKMKFKLKYFFKSLLTKVN